MAVSSASVVIIDPDFEFISRLSRELRELGFFVFPRTELDDLSELTDVKGEIAAFIINLELKNQEGLSLYASLRKNAKFLRSGFILLADDTNLYNLIKNMELEGALIFDKTEPFYLLIENILNHIPVIPAEDSLSDNVGGYITILDTPVREVNVKNILEFTKETGFTGNVHISIGEQSGQIILKSGIVDTIIYKNLDANTALNELIALNSGNLKVEQKIFSDKDILFYSTVQMEISLKDIFTDLFYFLHEFFAERLGEDSVRLIFRQKFAEYQENFDWFNDLKYDEEIQEKVIISKNPGDDQLELVILLFKEIFTELISLQNGSPVVEEFYAKLNEIQPLLVQFNLWTRFQSSALNEIMESRQY